MEMGEAIISMDELLFETRREGKLWLEEKLLNGPPGDRKSIAQDPNKRNGRRVTYVFKSPGAPAFEATEVIPGLRHLPRFRVCHCERWPASINEMMASVD